MTFSANKKKYTPEVAEILARGWAVKMDFYFDVWEGSQPGACLDDLYGWENKYVEYGPLTELSKQEDLPKRVMERIKQIRRLFFGEVSDDEAEDKKDDESDDEEDKEEDKESSSSSSSNSSSSSSSSTSSSLR